MLNRANPFFFIVLSSIKKANRSFYLTLQKVPQLGSIIIFLFLLLFLVASQKSWANPNPNESTPPNEGGLTTPPSHSLFVDPKEFPYPTEKVFLSTVSSAILRPVQFENLHFKDYTLFPERSSLAHVGDRNHVPVAFFKGATKQSPLVFYFPGLGSSAASPAALYMAELIQKKGFNVIVMSSTMSWQFALAASSTGTPGYGPQDAKDNLKLMRLAYGDFIKSYGSNPSSIYLVGTSLGATDVSFIYSENLKQNLFNITKVGMINPVLDPESGMNKLDELILAGSNFSNEHKSSLDNYAKGLLGEWLKSQQSPEQIRKTMVNLKLSEKQLSWLIGANYRKSLSEIIFVTLCLNKNPLFKVSIDLNKASRAEINTESQKYSFGDYYNLILKPNTTSFDLEDVKIFKQLYSWSQLESINNGSSNLNWAIYHTQNDFLWTQEGKDFFMTNPLQNGHSKIYPSGAHLGILWTPEFQGHLIEFLKLN